MMYDKNELKLAIERIKRKLWHIDSVEFRLRSIQKSYEYNPYRDTIYMNYRTIEPEGLFRELARFRYKFGEVNHFLNEKMFQVILDSLPETMKEIIKKAKELDKEARKHNLKVEVELELSMFVRVPSEKILEALKELERELGLYP